MIDYNRLNIETENELTITNSDAIIDYIKTIQLEEDSFEYLSTMLNKIKFGNYENADELINAISSKILEYEAIENEKNTNVETLRQMQEINEDLKKLNIKSTKRVDNDSNTYIDYITYTHEDGSVEVLVCNSDNYLNQYIKDHSEEVATNSAYEIFKHFKEQVHRDVEFKTEEELKNEEYSNIQDKNEAESYENERIQQEMELMRSYKENYGLTGEIQIGKDELNGERLYQIDGGLFKFQKVGDRLERQTIQEPNFKNYSNDDLLDELNSESLTPLEETKVESKNLESKREEEKEITYEEIDELDSQSFSIDYFRELLDKKDLYEIELTNEEEIYFNQAVKYLIESMEDRKKDPANKANDNVLDELLDRYLNGKCTNKNDENISRMEKYNEIEEHLRNEEELSDLEKQFIEQYYENVRYLKEQGVTNTLNKPKELVRTMNDPNKSGITTIIMLLEIAILALFVLLLMNIDI